MEAGEERSVLSMTVAPLRGHLLAPTPKSAAVGKWLLRGHGGSKFSHLVFSTSGKKKLVFQFISPSVSCCEACLAELEPAGCCVSGPASWAASSTQAQFSGSSRNNLPTGQNSHLAVEPAAPAGLCAGKRADCLKSAALPLWQEDACPPQSSAAAVESALTFTALRCPHVSHRHVAVHMSVRDGTYVHSDRSGDVF